VDLLELVQSLFYEAKLPGTVPSTAQGQSGRAGDLVRWVIEAYNDIQREKNGRWKWLRSEAYVDTVADDGSYAPTDFTDTVAAAAVSRFRDWELDEEEPPLSYLVSDGLATEYELKILNWRKFRYTYDRGDPDSGQPSYCAVDWLDNFHLGPKPSGIYRVTLPYWKSNQALSLDTDAPEMPSDYHMLIVYRAMTKYAFNITAHELLARARADGDALYRALSHDQGWEKWSVRTAGALA
jgi:hypothetical protein